ncbi:MAG: hypothetical protein WC596_04580 [Candidatus Shapirobacteria bacterium]
MKRAILVFTVFAFTLSLVSSLFSSSAFAQSPTSSDRQIRGGGITRTATSSSTSTTLSKLEQRNEKIRSFALQMQQRLSVIVGNLEKTASRVETQINKQINKSASSTVTSVDFSASQAKLADAKKKIDELKTGIAGLGQKAEEIMVSKTPKTAFYTVREKLVKAFVAKIKVIHKELLDSVKLAKKEIVKTNAQNATSTQDVSDWKTYRNEKFGFEIKYPKSLSIFEASGTINSSEPWFAQSGYLLSNISFYKEKDKVFDVFGGVKVVSTTDRETIRASFDPSEKESLPYWKTENINGNDFIFFDSEKIMGGVAYTVKNSRAYVITGGVNKNDFNKFLSNFKFIK